MPLYRIHRIRESSKEQFRWAPHTGGMAVLKQKDYHVGEELEAATPYALWSSMKARGNDLCPGDVLETVKEAGFPEEWQIFKYIGFEPAKWWIPEPKPEQKTELEGAQWSATFSAGPLSH
jgi:hypothetical protein